MHHARTVALIALSAALAACSENAVAPERTVMSTAVDGGGSRQSLSPDDTLHFTITIDPDKDASYDLGNGHSVYFPSGELCDPAKAKYGQAYWDQPCPKLNFKLTVNVTAWVDSAGHPFEDFSPSIRFLPTNNPSKYVVLSLTDPAAAVNPTMNILYCPTPTSLCTNEALSDPTEATQHDPVTGRVWRRIKHFSGYNVAAGDGDSIQPGSMSLLPKWHSGVVFGTLPEPPKPGKRIDASVKKSESGYILASGRAGNDSTP